MSLRIQVHFSQKNAREQQFRTSSVIFIFLRRQRPRKPIDNRQSVASKPGSRRCTTHAHKFHTWRAHKDMAKNNVDPQPTVKCERWAVDCFAHPVPPRLPPPAYSGQCYPCCAAVKPFPQPSPKKARRAPAQQCQRLVSAKERLFDLPARVGMNKRHRAKKTSRDRSAPRWLIKRAGVPLALHPFQIITP